MYKGTKKLDQSSIINQSINHLNTSILAETTNQTIEREIDNYTRILEQDKRKFFRVQESRNQIIKEHCKKIKELQEVKSKVFKTDTTKKKGQCKLLERELDQTISAYNKTLSDNNNLKKQIDQLRKEKKNQNQTFKDLSDKLEEYEKLIQEKKYQIENKTQKIGQVKSKIIKIKVNNESQIKNFQEEVVFIKNSLVEQRGKNSQKRKSEKEQSTEAMDTQPLVKLRLKHLINKNKERIKITQNYQKTMHAIYKSFEEIKEESGINDLEEIATSFLKQEEQNMLILQFINKLNKQIEDLGENNEELRKKNQFQKEFNQSYEKALKGAPEQENQKILTKFVEEQTKHINMFEQFLREVEPSIKEVKVAFGDFCDISVSKVSIESCLSELQCYINQLYVDEDECKSVYKEEVTKYTKMPPSISEDLKESKEEKILENQKLREFASDYWEKRKGK